MLRLATNESPYGPFPAARRGDRGRRVDDRALPRAGRRARRPARRAARPRAGADRARQRGRRASSGTSRRRSRDRATRSSPPGRRSRRTSATRRSPARRRCSRRCAADGAVDLDALRAALTPSTRLVWVCTPNNPTGASVGREELAAFLDAVPEDVLVVVDEAYCEFAAGPDHPDAIAEHVRTRPNVGSLRTFSKMHGLAGPADRLVRRARLGGRAAASRPATTTTSRTRRSPPRWPASTTRPRSPAAARATAPTGHGWRPGSTRSASPTSRRTRTSSAPSSTTRRRSRPTSRATGSSSARSTTRTDPDLLRITVGEPAAVDAVLEALRTR